MTNSKLTIGSVVRTWGISACTGELLYVVYIDLDNDRVYLINRDEDLLIATYSKVIDDNSNIDISKRLTTLRTFLFSDEIFLNWFIKEGEFCSMFELKEETHETANHHNG